MTGDETEEHRPPAEPHQTFEGSGDGRHEEYLPEEADGPEDPDEFLPEEETPVEPPDEFLPEEANGPEDLDEFLPEDTAPTHDTVPTHETAADEAHLAEAASELDAVEAALSRLDEGTFDSCEVCGAPIGRDRLLQDPLLTRCPQHTGGPPPAA